MKRTLQQRATVLPALAACLFIGGVAGWWLRSIGAPQPAASILDRPAATVAAPAPPAPPAAAARTEPLEAGRIVATAGEPLIAPAPPASLPVAGAIEELHRHDLRLPLDGVDVESMKGGFEERRAAGGRPHEAVDMLALRNTPIHAVEDGTVAKLFTSKAGGLTVYQFDPSGRFCYYYAHLQDYVEGLREGQQLSRGDVIGYVGTSGNAPANTPHLHFAVFELDGDRHWWKGRPIDPYLVFKP